MYHEFFGIEDNPFSITPDPRYLYMSKGHQEALAHLLYGVSANGGFVMLTGEVGTGKTSICRCLLEQLPNAMDVALILNPNLNEIEFVASICDELGIAYPKDTTSLKLLVDLLNKHLLEIHAEGRHGVVIIDEAQNLSPAVLEQVRLLTNLETAKQKLLQIILIGQPELSDLLGRRDMRQLAQRVTARYHLNPLTRVDGRAYVQHRLAVAGLPPDLFTKGAKAAVHRISRGIPRLINSICDRCLLGAYVQSRRTIDRRMVVRAAQEVLGRSRPVLAAPDRTLPWITAGAVAAAMLLVFVPSLTGSWFSFSDMPREVAAVFESGSRDEPKVASPAPTAVPAADTPQFSSLQIPAPDSSGAQAAQKTEPPAAGTNPATPYGEMPAESQAEAPVETASSSGAPLQTARLPEPATTPPEATEPAGPAAVAGDTSATADLQGYDIYQIFDPEHPKAETASALAALFAMWRIDPAQVDRSLPCAQWSLGGVRCLRGEDSLDNVLRLNRPAVVTLQDSEGNRAHVVLAGAQAENLTLMVEGERVTVPRSTLEPLWSSNYLVLWRAPTHYQRDLTRGLQGPDVAWLQNQLAEIDGRPKINGERAVFDSLLRQRVIAFQRLRGLEADGIVGAQTLIHLEDALRQKESPAPRDSAS